MISAQIRNGLQTGLVFGIMVTFLFLIGFTNTAAPLVGNTLQDNAIQPGFGLTAKMVNLLIFLGLLGAWAGLQAVKKSGGESVQPREALAGSIAAGLVHGLSVGGLAYLVGTLHAAGVRMSEYLAQVLPDTIQLFLLGKSPQDAALWYFGLMLLTGLLGGLLGFYLDRPGRRKSLKAGWTEFFSGIATRPAFQKMRASQAFRPVLIVLSPILLFTVPLGLGQYWNYTLGTVGIYVLLGLGLNIVVGLAGLLDLGYVAFFAIGAYSVALLTAPTPHHLEWNFWVALPIGIALAALAGILLGIPVLRMRGDYLAIVTLGFGEIIRILSKSDILTSFTGGPKGVLNIGGPNFLTRFLSSDVNYLYIIILAVFLAIFVTVRLQHSRVGLAWEAMREDETVAAAMGINTLQHKLMAFAIGAAFAGLGGVLFASRNQFTGPEDHNLMVSINVLAVVIVGGMGSIPGVIAGAFVLKGLPEILREMENYRVIIFGALLVIMMLVRPEGLFPSSRRKLEVSHEEMEGPQT
jgi:branched-chain amino acid transport system permease protein